MLTSLGIILLFGLIFGWIFGKLKLPQLLGMLLLGILVGPHALNLLDDSILLISADLRELALIIILFRAGLNLDLKDLKAVGRPAILLCFVPAIMEITAITIFAPMLFDIPYIEAAILGCVVAAVSPAVVVPRMLSMMEKGYGVKQKIPQMIMAGASVDDILVIILFTTFMQLAQGGSISAISFLEIPISIVLGVVVGIGLGLLLNFLFKRIKFRDSSKVIILLSVAALLVALQDMVGHKVPFSALLGVMFMGITILKQNEVLAGRLSSKFSKLWVGAEILLFVLVGCAVDLSVLKSVSLLALLLLAVSLSFRLIGTILSVSGSHLNTREKIFCAVSYMPKATVQAAIGAIPLTAGIASGNLILSIAVLSIIVTAPIGAILIDRMKHKI